MNEVRNYLAAHGAPSDYEIGQGLARLNLTGGGALRWRSSPVSMVCFNRGDDQMLFLFVIEEARLKDPPPPKPQVTREKDLVCVRWSQGGKAYLLAGPQEAGFLEKYLLNGPP